MDLRRRVFALCSVVGLAMGAGGLGESVMAQAAPGKLPPLKRQANARAVVDEHLDALNKCDWTRLVAQYPADVQFFLPGGQTIKGREEVGKLFANLVKPFKNGGLCGVKFETLHAFPVGSTLFVQWRATSEFLAEPYLGADAYGTADGLLSAIVTTFQPDQMKKK
jgi:hypothetical protein